MRHVAVFARWPEAGRVKTRFSPALPADLAVELHRAMLNDALAAVAAVPADSRTLFWAEATLARSDVALPPGFAARDQEGADLGARLERAFAGMLGGAGDRAVVIGADCPDLDAAHLDHAFERLADHDLVVGPARDGGYILIGLSRPAPALFRGVPWGTDGVLAATLERARAAGLRVARLEPLADLDTPADLVRWLAGAALAPAPGSPATRAALRAFGLLPTAGPGR